MFRILFSIASAGILLAAIYAFSPVNTVTTAQTNADDPVVMHKDTEFQSGKKMLVPKQALAKLKAKSSGIDVTVNNATGAVDFIRADKASVDLVSAISVTSKNRSAGGDDAVAGATDKSQTFFRENAQLFGIANTDTDLLYQGDESDILGGKHQTFRQFYNGVPVFGGILKTHFDKNNNLYAVNGSAVPDIEIDIRPQFEANAAVQTAIAKVADEKNANDLESESAKLFVFRTGLVQGIPGEDRLVWEVTVKNKGSVREFVYIDAHTGKFVDQYTGTPDALNRRAFDGETSTTNPPPKYTSNTPFWVEGQAFPTGNTEADNMIRSSLETYDFYKNSFGRDSFNAAGATMDSIFNRGYDCPNASWNGTFISFCAGLTTDDVTAHEWSHAYTEYTHNLVYAWQPGALNEGYSDIFGETVDRINGRDTIGNSAIDPNRTADNCSTNSPTPSVSGRLVINSPTSLVGTYTARAAAFGPSLATPVTGDVVPSVPADGCSPLTNGAAISGKIAYINSLTCAFTVKVKNAQLAGATGVIVYRTSANPTGLPAMTGTDATINIPSLGITSPDGAKITSALASGTVNTTLKIVGKDASTRWLLGEDDTGALAGALRDMYSPICYANPGKVSDVAFYVCSTADGGGVHTNSGVVNHAYALLVDGGTYNGQTVSGIGLTKAAHIYFRAESVYQIATSNFISHANSVEQSATDLIGVNLKDLTTGAPSGQTITAADVDQVKNAMLAVEMRTPPTFCNFQPLLAKSPPAEAACATNNTKGVLFADDFEGGTSNWSITTQNTTSTFAQPNWSVVGTLPDSRPGKGFFAPNLNNGTCTAASDQTGVRSLTSPVISVPADVAAPVLSFDHWVSLESGYDGGQLLYSVNGGTFTLVPAANFLYNQHTTTLATAASGNTNPRAGQRAWTGSDGGQVVGSWGKTMVNLAGLVSAGQTVQLRWDESTDGCGGTTLGWYLDNVKVSACVPATGGTLLESDVFPRPNGDGSVSATNDLPEIGQLVVGKNAASGSNEFQRTDAAPRSTKGNGLLSAADYAQAGRYAAGLDTLQSLAGPTAPVEPKTYKAKKSMPSVENAIAATGDVNVVSVNRTSTKLTVGIVMAAGGTENTAGFTLNFDPAVLSNPTVAAGSGAGGAALFTNTAQVAAGKLGVLIGKNGGQTFSAGSVQLATIEFNVVTNAPSSTNFSFANTPVINEIADSNAAVMTSNFAPATISLLIPSAAQSSISGRVVSSSGRGISNAKVTVVNAQGVSVSTRTNPFGYFKIANLESAETYVLNAEHKNYEFAPAVVNLSADLTDFVLTANP